MLVLDYVVFLAEPEVFWRREQLGRSRQARYELDDHLNEIITVLQRKGEFKTVSTNPRKGRRKVMQ